MNLKTWPYPVAITQTTRLVKANIDNHRQYHYHSCNVALEGLLVSDSDTELDFEKSLEELEKIVADLEKGQLSLDKSLAAYERGVRLTRQCEQALSAAEQRVQKLVDEKGTPTTVPLDLPPQEPSED